MKKILLLILSVIITSSALIAQTDTLYQQNDSLLFREQDLKRISTNYFNLSKPNKFNFEVVVIGGVKNSGIYLVPQGTTLVEIVALTGGAPDESIFEDFKLVRTKYKNPELKKDTVIVIDYNDFFERNKSGEFTNITPILLKPGDIISFPIKPEKEFWDIAQRVAGVVIVPILTALTLILNIMIYNK
ncbi:MAG: SLBB domain-containing protein [Candidatus Kapaibacterium sp.]